jgi:hypothetical protein
VKTIIAGSRDVEEYATVAEAVRQSGFEISEVVSGAARGVDRLGELWAERRGVAVKRFPALWNKHGRRAGPLRNLEMADYADALIAVRRNGSPGTSHMILAAQERGLKIFVMDLTT